jgi:hypothetical protein
MPYICETMREPRRRIPIETQRELSYEITFAILQFLEGKELDPQVIGEVWAAIEGAKQAFDHEVAQPFEAKIRKETGAIFRSLFDR